MNDYEYRFWFFCTLTLSFCAAMAGGCELGHPALDDPRLGRVQGAAMANPDEEPGLDIDGEGHTDFESDEVGLWDMWEWGSTENWWECHWACDGSRIKATYVCASSRADAIANCNAAPPAAKCLLATPVPVTMTEQLCW